MDFFETVLKRRSYRGEFLNQEIKRDDLIKIVKAGLEAPSACNSQTTRFLIIDDKEIVNKIRKIDGMCQAMKTANAYIVAIMDKNPMPVFRDLIYQKEDCASSVENMLLAITDLGYASVWIDGVLKVNGNAEKIASFVNLPQDKMINIILPIGVPKDKNIEAPKKLSFGDRVTFNSF